MTPRPRFLFPIPLAAILAALIAVMLLPVGSLHAAAPLSSAAGAADSTRGESTPGKLIVPPTTRSTQSPAAPPDTALASRVRKAREDFGKGLMLEEQKAYAAAIVSYANAARMDPGLRGPAYRIGLLYASRQQYGPAARAFREELHRNPNDPAATMEYALSLAELGDTTRSVRMLEALTRRSPGDAGAWRSLGFVYGRAGRYDEAERALRGAVGLNPKFARAWRDLGVMLAARGKDSEAREAYRRALAVDPSDETSLINMGNLEARAGNHATALAHYHEAELRDSSQAWAYRGQVRELVTLGRQEEAGTVWRRWLKVAPEDAEVREGAARHFVHMGRNDVALEIAREGVRLAPRSGEAWWLLGEMQSDALSALSAYRKATSLFRAPDDRARAEAAIAVLRASAPDSLRSSFSADSVAAAARDSTSARRR